MLPLFSRLRLRNFKGYRDEVSIEWKQFSSIVGPNGVGKSTITDAIEYVFCFPTYAKLSVGQLRTDICNNTYSNSDSPDCPSTTVEVTFYHADHEREKIFERSTVYEENVHRYSIDGEEVTPKEYKERLLEYHINPRANNFFVKQNSIVSIATMNAKERCEFFERSSNSIAYKSECNRLQRELKQASLKAEASKKEVKLFSTQVRQLGKLSKVLEEYKKLQEDSEETELEYYFASLYKIDTTIDKARKNTEKLRAKIRVAEKIKKSYEEKIVEIKKALEEEDEAKLDELQLQLAEHSQTRKTLEEYLRVQESRITKIEANKKNAEEQDAASKRTIDNLSEQLATVEKEKDEMERFDSLSSFIQLNEEQYEEYLRLKSDCMKNCVKEIEIKDSIQRDRDIINDKIEAYERKQKSLLDQIKIETSILEKLKTDIDQTKKHRDHSESEIEKFSREICDLEMDMQNDNSRIQTLNDDINDLIRKIGESKDTVELDKKTRRKNEIINKLKSLSRGVYGRLKDLCDIADERYNIAITKILGKKMNFIVVDNTDTAQKCILFLKEQFAGCPFSVVETYLPIDNIKIKDQTHVESYVQKMTEDKKLNMLLATEVVSGNASFEIDRVLLHLLGNIVICETDDEALELSRKKNFECVSLNGTHFRKDGIFSGGSASLLEKSRVWSEKEVENFKKQRDMKKDEMKNLYLELRKKKEMKYDMEVKLSGLRSRLKNYLEPLLTEQQKNFKTNQSKLSKLEGELSAFENTIDIKGLKQEFKKIDNDLIEIKKKIEAIENVVFATFCQKLNIDNIQQYEKGDVKKYKQRCDRKKQIYDLIYNIKYQIENEKSRYTEDNVKKLDDELSEFKKYYCKAKDDQVVTNNKIEKTNRLIQSEKRKLVGDQKRKELKVEEKKLVAVNNDLREWESDIRSDDIKITRLEAEKHEILMNCWEKRVKIPIVNSTIEKVVMNTKVAINTESESSSNSQSENVSQILEKDVVIDYSNLPKSISNLAEEALNNRIKSLEKKLTEIRKEIKSIDVNPKTKAQYETMKDKIQVLNRQYKTSLSAVADIKKKLDEVKNQRVEAFKQFFNLVANNIDVIFKNLYGSPLAQAVLNLRSEEEPYLDGIEFHCIIPEKKFCRIDNFSGGEKTMSAIALLIATYKAMPTSFLIFDEIDAALDNRNIAKVIKYFNQLKPTTQIINISHHNQLSAFADAMIGVNFTPRNNTSHVVHIDFSKYQKDIQPAICLPVMAEERLSALIQEI